MCTDLVACRAAGEYLSALISLDRLQSQGDSALLPALDIDASPFLFMLLFSLKPLGFAYSMIPVLLISVFVISIRQQGNLRRCLAGQIDLHCILVASQV